MVLHETRGRAITCYLHGLLTGCTQGQNPSGKQQRMGQGPLKAIERKTSS